MDQIPVFGKKIESVVYRPRPGAYGIIINAAGLLATIFIYKGYYLPGGGQEPGESIEECLKRELLEELGCEFDSAESIGRADEYFQSLMNDEYYLWQGHYHDIAGFRVVGEPTDKSHSVEWLPVEKAQSALRHESQRWALNRIVRTRRT